MHLKKGKLVITIEGVDPLNIRNALDVRHSLRILAGAWPPMMEYVETVNQRMPLKVTAVIIDP